MIHTSELARDFSFPWEYGEQPDLSLSWRQKLDRMSKRVRQSFSPRYHLPPEAREYSPSALDAMEITPDPQFHSESALKNTIVSMSHRVRDAIDTHLDDAMENVQQLSTALVFVVLIGAGIKTTEVSGSAFVALGTLASAVLGMKLIRKPRLETLADYRYQKK